MASTVQTITVKQAAALFGRSERWVHRLREAGWIATEGRGAYPLVSLVRGVLAYLEDQVEKQADAAKAASATDARTREVELKIEARRRELVAADAVAQVIEQFDQIATAEFGRLPARFSRRPADRARLRGEVDASITRIAAARDRALASLKD